MADKRPTRQARARKTQKEGGSVSKKDLLKFYKDQRAVENSTKAREKDDKFWWEYDRLLRRGDSKT